MTDQSQQAKARARHEAKWKAQRAAADAEMRLAGYRDAVVTAAEAFQARGCVETFRVLMEAVRALRAARKGGV